jgi:hypothetical protein
MRRIAAPGIALLLTLALAACAPATAAPSAAPSRTPSASATPTPVAVAPASPRFAFDIGCAGLLGASEAQAQLTAPISVVVDESSPRVDDLQLAQSAGLTCLWGGTHRTDSSYDDSVRVTVLPAATSELATWTASAGEQCAADQPICIVDARAGEAWVEVTLSAAGGSPSPIGDEARAIADRIADRVAGATPRTDRWSAPSGVLVGIADCAAATPKAATAAGVDASSLTWTHPLEHDAGQQYVATQRSGFAACGWSNGDRSVDVDWAVLPGGAWAFAGMTASRPPVFGWGMRFHATTIAGADAAWSGCGPACAVIAEVRGSLVTMAFDADLDEATLDAQAAARIAAFAD